MASRLPYDAHGYLNDKFMRKKQKKKKNEMILDVSTENMHKRRSLDGNVQEQALPIPVQMFLWRQLRYLYIYILLFSPLSEVDCYVVVATLLQKFHRAEITG